ncbi:MAG: hypothetical protein P8Z73_01165 [Desulfobacteraceae bacterium]
MKLQWFQIAFATLLMSLVAVGPLSTQPGSLYREASLLAELVSTGKLPPVGQCLPQNPMLIHPRDLNADPFSTAPEFPTLSAWVCPTP